MNHSIGSLQERIKKLVSENYSYEEEMRLAQANLRLSSNQNAKMAKELNEYRQRIDQNNLKNETLKGKIGKLVSENSSLGEEAKSVQESVRLSTATQAKLARELNEYK
jgi:chromosome segregation ATPase